jgi:phenylalanyl-tRNA synthetase beta chain
VAFEVTLSSIPVSRSKSSARAAFNASDLMPVSRDFAFVVDETVAADRILKAVRGADKSMIGDATIFDVFAGGTFPPGKKSVAVAVTLQPRDRTLTDAEIETISQKIISEVARATGATLRS